MEEISEGSQEAEKMLYIISKKSESRCEIKKINKIKAKDPKKLRGDSSNYSRD